MEFFDKFTSNSVAGSSNQLFFSAETAQTGRVFYKMKKGGEFSYSLLFSNVIDSTFSNGAKSHKNLICDSWEILQIRIGALQKDKIPPNFTDQTAANEINASVTNLLPLTFNGKSEKTVAPGEFFASDPISLSFEKGDYLCLEMTVSGPMIPYHEETLLPAYVCGDQGWAYNRKTPVAGMIGCDFQPKHRVGYLGDSITQGCGTPRNAYTHWNALLSEMMGDESSYWNLGIGYGRADDLASDGAWLFKAKQNDTVFLCAGVNDLMQGFSAEQIIKNLTNTLHCLKKAGVKVILQTVPPFNYAGERIDAWNRVNHHIRTALSEEADAVFDVVPLLGQADAPHLAKYGGHPNEEGNRLWAEELYRTFKDSDLLK